MEPLRTSQTPRFGLQPILDFVDLFGTFSDLFFPMEEDWLIWRRPPHGAPWAPWGPMGPPWAPMGPHGALWGPMGAPWGPTGSHGVPWTLSYGWTLSLFGLSTSYG